VMVGPMQGEFRGGMMAGMNAQAGMGMTQGGSALSHDNGPSMGRAMGENTGAERAVPTMPMDMQTKKEGPKGVPEHEGAGMHDMKEARKVPGYPADMMDMMVMPSESEIKKLAKPETRGMRRDWFAGIEALHTIVRVLPPELYDKVVSGKGGIAPGASVPGGHENHH
jgi:manganese oxidase